MQNTLLQKILLPLVLMSTMLTCPILAQEQKQLNSAEILAAMQRLNVVGSVLYVAAHPDDENSRLLAYLVGEKKLYATYLSLTRGDGGQNLIGTEQDEMLGLLRTYELLAARAIDGAGQLFTRARDLGYTKRADEALAQWGHEEVLSDVVLAIRRFQPDVIITRFNTLPPNHGHHTASAILAAEAFTAAADPKKFPEQLKLFPAWKSDRLLHNVTTWGLPEKADMSMYLKLDVGGYDPVRGMSWTEIAAKSRSMHKSQGFGVAAERGPSLEYFKPLQGALPKTDIFEGLDFSWKRFKGGEKVSKAVDLAVKGFEVTHPEKSIAALWNVHAAMKEMPDNLWKQRKLAEVEALLLQCAGMVLDVRAAEPTACPGDEVKLSIIALNRSGVPAKILSVELPDGVTKIDAELVKNLAVVRGKSYKVPSDARVSYLHWGGEYPDVAVIGLPEPPPALTAKFAVEIGGRTLSVMRSARHVWTDSVRGELSRLFEIAPRLTAAPVPELLMMPSGQKRTFGVQLSARKDVATTLFLEGFWFRGHELVPFDCSQGQLVRGISRPPESCVLPDWTADPDSISASLKGGDQLLKTFSLSAPSTGNEPMEIHVLSHGDRTSGRKRELALAERTINYEHIPPVTYRHASVARAFPLKINLGIKHIGYIPGPGDRVAESLSAIGYDVTQLPLEKLAAEPLEKFEAIVVGIRAFNQTPQLAGQREKLLKYVEQGGRLLVQYQTNSRIAALSVPIGPYPLEIGRDRVTDENAAMLPLDPTDTLLQKPNLLTKEDFQGWVQERGLYFASSWDPHYRPVFAMHDQDEAPLKGGLLVAKYGKGTFIYTGLAFFRQLPAGVPGAYRLLANLLAM